MGGGLEESFSTALGARVQEEEQPPLVRLQGGSALGGDLASVQTRRGRLSARKSFRGRRAWGLIHSGAAARLPALGTLLTAIA